MIIASTKVFKVLIRQGLGGQHCWAGFHIIDLAEDQAAALEILLKHL